MDHNYRVDNVVNKFNEKILVILEELAPLKKVTLRRNFAPWLNSDLKASIKVRNRLHQLARNQRTPEDWTNWKRYRNDLKMKLRNAKEKYTRDYLNHEDSSTKWSQIKKYSGIEKESS